MRVKVTAGDRVRYFVMTLPRGVSSYESDAPFPVTTRGIGDARTERLTRHHLQIMMYGLESVARGVDEVSCTWVDADGVTRTDEDVDLRPEDEVEVEVSLQPKTRG